MSVWTASAGFMIAAVGLAFALAACGSEPNADRRPVERAETTPVSEQEPQGGVAGATSEPQRAEDDRNERREAQPAADRSAQARQLLPDLKVLPPKELYIEDGAVRKIRFSTTVANIGEGPLDLAGSFDAASGITTASQRIHRSDGEIEERVAGSFMFHPGHEHWHFEDFTMLELWTYREDGALDAMKATTGKATFCAVDEILEYETLERVPEGPSFLACGQGVQGISVGWSDTYTADLIGQELDITNVPDGSYAVRTVVDPALRLVETNDDNNDLVVFVDLEGDTIRLRDAP